MNLMVIIIPFRCRERMWGTLAFCPSHHLVLLSSNTSFLHIQLNIKYSTFAFS